MRIGGAVRILVGAGLENHDHFLERAIAGALADSVDGAFHLARAGFDGGQRVGHRQTQIVVAVYAHDGVFAQRPRDAPDQLAVFLGRGIAHRIGNVHRAGARRHDRFRNRFQIVGIGARAVFGRKFHVIHIAARQFHRGHGFVQNLLLGLVELVFQMDFAGGDKGVDAGAGGAFQALGGAFHVERAAARQRRYAAPREIRGHGGYGFEVAFGGDRKAGLQNVHSQLHQLGGHSQLLRHGHAATRRLFAVAQRGVEDIYVVGHRRESNTRL